MGGLGERRGGWGGEEEGKEATGKEGGGQEGRREEREESDGEEKRQGGITVGSPCSQWQRLQGRIKGHVTATKCSPGPCPHKEQPGVIFAQRNSSLAARGMAAPAIGH